MERTALVGLLVCLAAGTASAQTGSVTGVPQEFGSQRIVLKGVGAEKRVASPAAESPMISRIPAPPVEHDPAPVTPAAASTMISTMISSATKLQETTGAVESGEMATCDRCGQSWTECCCNCCDWIFLGEFLYLQPRGADPVFAARALNCFSPPIAGANQIDFGGSNGFKVGLGKVLCDGCSELVGTWTHFESRETGHANRTTGTDVLLPLLAHPDLLICATPSTLARAESSIDFDRVNLDYKSYVDYGCCQFDWLVGFSYGQLEQELKARYDEGRVDVTSDSWGYGVHLGGGVQYSVGCMRFFGHSDLTLLASQAKASYSQVDVFDGQAVNYHQDLDRIIPVVDLELGVAMDLCKNTVLKVGYTYSFWYNVVTTPAFVRDVQKGDIVGNTGDTLTFDGLFARVEVKW